MALAQALMMGYRPLTTYDFDNKTYVRGPVGTATDLPSAIHPSRFSYDGLTLLCFRNGNITHLGLNTAYDITDFSGTNASGALSFAHTSNTNDNMSVVFSSDGLNAIGIRENRTVQFMQTDTAWDFTSNATVTNTSSTALPSYGSTSSPRSAGLSPDDAKLYITTESSGIYEFSVDFSTQTVASYDAVGPTLPSGSDLNSNVAVGPDHVLVGLISGYCKIPRVSGTISGQSSPTAITTDSHGTTHNDAIIYSNDGSTLWFYETAQDQWFEYDTSN